MTAAGGGGMGPNVGLADLKFRFVGRSHHPKAKFKSQGGVPHT